MDGEPPVFPDPRRGGGRALQSKSRWRGIRDLDQFFIRVYQYYERKGFRSMILARLLNLFTFGFTAFFCFFLFGCVDYGKLKQLSDSGQSFTIWEAVSFDRLDDLHPVLGIALAVFGIFWLFQLLQFVYKIREKFEMRTFYRDELGISDDVLQTMYWSEVQQKLLEAQDRLKMCIVKPHLTPLDIAMRIMRADNYMIALMNKDLLNISLPLPFLAQRKWLPESLEFFIKRVIMGCIFDPSGRVLLPERADTVAADLSHAFKYWALVNLVFSPFILVFLVARFFFRYAEEFKQAPGKLGMRAWTTYAKWRIRHINELPQYLEQRLTKAYEPATGYLVGFTSEPINLVARFVAFVTGSVVAVLTVLSIWDEDFLLRGHVFGDRSVLWALTLFGVILAVSRGLLPAENTVIDPAFFFKRVFHFLHYYPSHWRKRVHTQQVADEFAELFQYKILIFAVEILSVLLNPFILFFSLPKRSREIVDFIRENSENVAGVGHVYSNALLDLRKLTDSQYGVPMVADEELNARIGPPPQTATSLNGSKLEMSYLAFQLHNPDFAPPSSRNRAYLARLKQALTAPGGAPSSASVGTGSRAVGPVGAGAGSVVWQRMHASRLAPSVPTVSVSAARAHPISALQESTDIEMDMLDAQRAVAAGDHAGDRVSPQNNTVSRSVVDAPGNSVQSFVSALEASRLGMSASLASNVTIADADNVFDPDRAYDDMGVAAAVLERLHDNNSI